MIKQIVIDLSRGRIAGHPIHMMLVHFPSALYPVAVVFAWIAKFWPNHCFSVMVFYLLLLAIIISILAAVFGALDYSKLVSTDPAWNTASLHALLNITWLMLFTIMLALQIKSPTPTWPALIIGSIAVSGLIVSNYLGAELVIRYQLARKD